MLARVLFAVAVLGCGTSVAGAASAATARPARPSATLPAPQAPRTKQHTEFVVETNRLGQVTHAVKVTRSSDSSFNALTYGNALQAFIRTGEGGAVAGTYRLSYDYNPANRRVHRSVELLKMGGVNPNAVGAVYVEAAKLDAQQKQARAASAEASALPSLHQMTRHHH